VLLAFATDKLSDLNIHDWVILMTPKEREIKTAGRLFGVTPMELR